MSHIASRAKVSKGTLYVYFQSRVDLFQDLMSELSQTNIEDVFSHSVTSRRDLSVVLETAAQSIIRSAIAPWTIGISQALLAEGIMSPGLKVKLRDYWLGASVDDLSLWLREICDREFLEIEDCELAAEQFLALCRVRIVNNKLFQISDDCSDQAIERMARSARETFLKIYN